MTDQAFHEGFQRLSPEEQAELTAILERQAQIRENQVSTVVGLVCPEKGFTHALRKDENGKWQRTHDQPDMYLPAKMERVLTTSKRFIVVIGGRGCYPAGTEFLTPAGWKRIEDYQSGDPVLVYDKDTGDAHFDADVSYIDRPADSMYRIQNRKVDFTTSDGHRHLMRNEKTGSLEVLRTHEIVEKHDRLARGCKHKLIRTFTGIGGPGIDMTDDMIRLYVAIYADGHYPKQSKTVYRCRINLKRQRKIDRLRLLLQKSGIEYREVAGANGFRVFQFYMPDRDKEFRAFWYGCNQHQLQVVCDEVLRWDGSTVKREGRQDALGFTSTSKATMDFIQYAFHATGARADVHVVHGNQYRQGYIYEMCVSRHITESSISKDRKAASTTEITRVPADRMYCFGTNTGYFVVRQNGRVYVSGNSAKSVGVADVCLADARDNLTKTYCLREYQSSIRSSVHSLLKSEIDRLEFPEFEVLQSSISVKGHEAFEFAGISRNIESIKSAHGFKRYFVEESQFISRDSLKGLTPTARNKPNKGLPGDSGDAITMAGVSIIFVANPGSTEDPFSERFINPYIDHIERDGYYEDDLHLIIQMNYTDNPWFHDSGLEAERLWDYENLPRALYDHIWLGKFNDSVDNSLIMSEWFDACVDAHKKLGWGEPKGARIAAHDPSDGGEDTKGYAMRHGSVILDIQEKVDGNVNEGGHWAANIAIAQQVDHFEWDGDGMGAGLSEQMGKDFEGKKLDLVMFRGSENPDHPEDTYNPAQSSPVQNQQKNQDVFKNKRAQYYFALRDRVYRTYRAVVHGEYHDPDKMISFSSDMPLISKLRAEVCRIPVKPNTNGLNELYTKKDMKRIFKISSPNLADSVMMSMRYTPPVQVKPYIPRPIRPMRTR